MATVNELPINPENDKPRSKRKFFLILLTLIFLIIAILYGLYWFLVARFYEETDDAYVSGHIIPITSQVAGTIVLVKVDDTQYVKAKQLLVELDPIDSLVTYQHARAMLGRVIRDTQQYFLNNAALEARIKNREASQQKALQDLSRRNQGIDAGAVSKEDLTHAEDTLKEANASLIQARANLLSNLALTENTDLRRHPSVLAAAATLRQAYIAYMRGQILAPTAGEIAKRTAQVGQRIGIGTQLMALVPLNELWVDGNFKERQMKKMRIGQPVKLTADFFGSSVVYHGKIVGFAAGTGAAFALLPAQNATGNWIKVVQRLPVRIALDPKELKAHPLRIGLSMRATVDLHDTSGPFISEKPLAATYTLIFDNLGKKADAEVDKVISENINKTASLGLGFGFGKKEIEK